MKHARPLMFAALVAFACGATGCFHPPRNMPNDSAIGYDGQNAIPPDCDALARGSHMTDAGRRRPAMQWGCATYTNLAAQLARPADIVAPQTLGPANGATAASAIRRYETGHVIPLDTSTSREAK
jgi:pilus assembly protein CpaD